MKKLLKSRKKYGIIGLLTAIVLVAEILIVNLTSKTYAATLPEKFDLRSEIDIVVKNQYSNGIYPYMSRSSMVETHVKMGQKNGKYEFFKETPVFSALTGKPIGKYVPISIDKTEKVIQELYGGNINNEDDILKIKDEYRNKNLVDKISELQPSLDFIVDGKKDGLNSLTEKRFKSILKEYTDNGIVYKGEKGETLSEEQVKQQRAEYKDHIMKNGGIRCDVQTNGIRGGVNGGSVCLNKTITTAAGNHSALIIGWDDTYSKDNFPEDNRPSTDGAYLVLNSWGAEWGDNGTFYVSYEDLYIEEFLLGIDEITEYKDTTCPVISAKVNENSKITITASDKYSSGIKEGGVRYLWSDHNIMPELTDPNWVAIKNGEEIENFQNKYLWLYGEDNAGNIYFSCKDSKKSEIAIKGANEECSTWSNKDAIVKISDVWALLGKASSFEIVTTSSTISMEELKRMEVVKENFDHILTIDKDGKHTIYISRISDGREDEALKVSVWIDKTNPTDAVINVNGNKDGEKYYKGVVIEIKGGEDTVSGVKDVNIEIKDKNGKDVEVQNKNKFDLSNAGTYTIKVITIDNAGNKSEVMKTIDVMDKEEQKEEDKPADQEEEKKEDKPTDQEEEKKEDKPTDQEEEKKEDKPTDREDGNKEVKPMDQEEEKKENKPTNQEEQKKEDKPIDQEDENKEDKPTNQEEEQKENKLADQEENKKNGVVVNTKVENNGDRLEIDTKEEGISNPTINSNNNQIIYSSNSKKTSIGKSEQVQTQSENRANKILPATGSNTEIILIILVLGIAFIFIVIHTYKKVKNNM